MSVKPYIEDWIAGYDGTQFYTRLWAAEAPKAVILHCHGFAEHTGRYDNVFSKWPERGITFFAFDQRGFGRTALDEDRRSKTSAYGRTSRIQQLADVEFFTKLLVERYPQIPLFLTGHSMGGGLVFSFFTRAGPSPSPEVTKHFSGVICLSPFFILTHPKNKLLRSVGAFGASIMPNMLFPADLDYSALSRDQSVGSNNRADPLCKQVGSLRLLNDMLSGGEASVRDEWKNWPKELPILFVHGTADQITSPQSTEEIYKKLVAQDKKMLIYEGSYHELMLEIDNVPQKLIDEVTDWITSRCQKSD